MKTLICQRWKTSAVDGESGRRYIPPPTHSLHLNEQHRLRFLNKNIKNNFDVNVKEHYQCEVEDDIYEQVIRHQTKHGLMFENSPLPERTQPSSATIGNLADMAEFLKKFRLESEVIESEEKVTTIKPTEGNYFVLDSYGTKTGIIPPYKSTYQRRVKVVDPDKSD